MASPVNTILDFGGARRITNLGAAQAATEPVILSQLQSAIEGLAWKDSVRVASTVNVTISSPGTAIDGITLTTGDRVLLKNQTSQPENGIYIFNGSASPMTRALDASTFDELEGAVVVVEEGTTNAGTTWRQTQVNGVIATNNVIFTSFGTSAPAASETVSGIAELATQAETDTGTDDLRIVTPLKLATYSGRAKRFSQTIGDGSSTSIAVTHNLNTKDVVTAVVETGGSEREIFYECRRTSVNQCTFLFDSAPASNSLRVTIIA